MTRAIPLEDSWTDVIRKARRGLGLSPEELALQSGLSTASVSLLEQGESDEENLSAISEALGLHPQRLLALAHGAYYPGHLELPEGPAGGLTRFTSPWEDFEVHSYLLWDARTGVATAFDTGSDAGEMLGFLKIRNLRLEQILLTHGHGDHVFELDRLVEVTGAKAWIGERENVPGAECFVTGKEFSLGSLRISTRSTWGHAVGGVSYVIDGLDQPVAVVGDAIFAGSMGGPMISLEACLRTNRQELLSLPPETLLCPGHGPLTTVGLERENNPFFP